MIVVLGAGLAGLSAAYHIGHDKCVILEAQNHPFGHISSEVRDGFTWDEGPHVSFTTDDYVKDLFARSVADEYDEYEVRTCNYFRGHWIDHPAQSNLYQVPEPIRTNCVQDFLSARSADAPLRSPDSYAEWLKLAFGETFAHTFPFAYTRKYWTVDPKSLTTDWVGPRVFYPSVEEVLAGAKGPLPRSTHYITKVRYPRAGGYQAFGGIFAHGTGTDIRVGWRVSRVDLAERRVYGPHGESLSYSTLISTIPLPELVGMCVQSNPEVKAAAEQLSCSQLLLVNVAVPHRRRREDNWIYVYDEQKYSTRIHFVDKLTAGNAPPGWTGIQVEVYSSKYRGLDRRPDEIAERVVEELIEMGLLDGHLREAEHGLRGLRVSWKTVPWANVIFDQHRRHALDTVLTWLTQHGLAREEDDLEPTTNWRTERTTRLGPLVLAGRFGQWKYYWTDDCVLRGRTVASGLAR
jgi:protoporphyrinogen oxidase